MCPNMLKPNNICLFPQKVSFVTVTLPNQCWNTPSYLKQVIFQVRKCPILEYFHEIILDEYKYAKTLNTYVCFHNNIFVHSKST